MKKGLEKMIYVIFFPALPSVHFVGLPRIPLVPINLKTLEETIYFVKGL